MLHRMDTRDESSIRIRLDMESLQRCPAILVFGNFSLGSQTMEI